MDQVGRKINLGNCSAVDDHDLTVHKTVAIAAHEGGVFR
jgi:hypothetical protein